MVYLSTSPPMLCLTTIFLHFFTQLPLSILSNVQTTLVYLLYAVSYAYQPQAISQLIRRLSILQYHITQYHHHVISLQHCQDLFFHCLMMDRDKCVRTDFYIKTKCHILLAKKETCCFHMVCTCVHMCANVYILCSC